MWLCKLNGIENKRRRIDVAKWAPKIHRRYTTNSIYTGVFNKPLEHITVLSPERWVVTRNRQVK